VPLLTITIEDEDRGRWDPLAVSASDGTRVLVVLAGAGFDPERLRAEARRADFVVAADAGAALALDAGLALEAVVGDFDSLDAATRARLDPERLYKSADPHTNDLEKALAHVAATWGARTDVVLAAGGHVDGGRMDHALANLGPLVREPHARVSMLDGEGRLFALRHGAVRVAGGEGRTVSLLPWTLHGVVASETGMEFPLERAKVSLGGQGLSNRIVAPVAELTVHDGVALVWIEA
jgi:thiamine pyrophosphokinase